VSELLDAALRYADRGWPVLPLRPGTKLPATSHGLRDASTDPAVIRAWWQRWPTANLGIRTGAVSGLVILDVDGAAGLASLDRLEAEHGPLAAGPAVSTPNGQHRYFLHPGGVIRNTAGQVGKGLDIRGDGGYVVAPPSVLDDGRGYSWATPPTTPLSPVPEWVIRRPPARERPTGTTLEFERPSSNYAAAALGGETEKVRTAPVGSRNATLNVAALKLGSLVAAGVLDEAAARGALAEAAVAAGLGDAETGATIESGMRAGLAAPRAVPKRRFHVSYWSSP